jgi:drug/metabolite transporter (DMT)-like permease
MENTGTIGIQTESKGSIIAGVFHKDMLPFAAIITAVFLWGGSFSAMRVVVRNMDPWSMMWLRMIIGFVLLLPFAVKLRPRQYRKGDWKLLIPMVLFLPCLYFLFESYAMCYTTSSQAGVISASVPLLVAIGAWLTLSESLNVKTIIGFLLSVTGVIFLTLSGTADGIAKNPLLGNSLEFCAMVFAAGNMLIVKRLSSRYNPWTLTALQVCVGSVFFLPGLFPLLRAGMDIWTLKVAAAIFFLGSFVTLGAFGLYNWGMSRIPASKASAFVNLVPVTAVFIGWVLLGEALNPYQCASAIVVIFGVCLSQNFFRPGR